jgi:16S rRNA (uracil1498-N3)-methyltransferase
MAPNKLVDGILPMSSTRIFSPTPLQAGGVAGLTGGAARHLAKALRLQVGDEVTLFDGSGLEYPSVISAVSKSAVALNIGAGHNPETESPLELELWQGISKGTRMDTVVQKATELGVRRIKPIFTAHGVVKLDTDRSDKRTERWQDIAISACEQSGRVIVPEILVPEKFEQALSKLLPDVQAIILVPGEHPPLQLAAGKPTVVLIVGPEGGFSRVEEELAAAHGVIKASMGARVLRTETAPLAALSILQFQKGDMG